MYFCRFVSLAYTTSDRLLATFLHNLCKHNLTIIGVWQPKAGITYN